MQGKAASVNEEHSSDEEATEQRTGVYITELSPHDVLLGRGTGPSMNEGNVHFRNAVENMKLEYVSTPSRKAKKKIVRKTVEAIQAKKGRFLSKLRRSEIKMLGLPHKVVYEVVSDSIAIEKTKQAIRYIHYKKDAKNGNKRVEIREKVATRTIKSPQLSSMKPSSSKDGSDVTTSNEDPNKETAGTLNHGIGNRRLPDPAPNNRSNVFALFPSLRPEPIFQSLASLRAAQASAVGAPMPPALQSTPMFASNTFNAKTLLMAGGLSPMGFPDLSTGIGINSTNGKQLQTGPSQLRSPLLVPQSRELNDAFLRLAAEGRALSSGIPTVSMSGSAQVGNVQNALQDERIRAALLNHNGLAANTAYFASQSPL